MPSQTYSYQAFGLTIASSMALPELAPQPGAPDVSVHYGAVPDALETAEQREAVYEFTTGTLLLRIPGIAKFLVMGGRRSLWNQRRGFLITRSALFSWGPRLARFFTSGVFCLCTAAPLR